VVGSSQLYSEELVIQIQVKYSSSKREKEAMMQKSRIQSLILTFLAIDLLGMSGFVIAGPAGPGNRKLLESNPVSEATEDVNEFLSSVWGGVCYTNSQCAGYISHCDKDQGITVLDGECRIDWWVWLVLAIMVLLLMSSCISCICLPCCCLYACCSNILDCLCCCFSSRRGYSPARTG